MLKPWSIRDSGDPGLTSAIASATTKSSLSISASNCCASMQFLRSLSLVVGIPGMDVARHGAPRVTAATRRAAPPETRRASGAVMLLLFVTAAFMSGGPRSMTPRGGLDSECGGARPSRGCEYATRKARARGRRRALWRAPSRARRVGFEISRCRPTWHRARQNQHGLFRRLLQTR